MAAASDALLQAEAQRTRQKRVRVCLFFVVLAECVYLDCMFLRIFCEIGACSGEAGLSRNCVGSPEG